MKLTTRQIEEFIAIYQKNFWTELSQKEALDLATSLLTISKNILLSKQEGSWKLDI